MISEAVIIALLIFILYGIGDELVLEVTATLDACCCRWWQGCERRRGIGCAADLDLVSQCTVLHSE